MAAFRRLKASEYIKNDLSGKVLIASKVLLTAMDSAV